MELRAFALGVKEDKCSRLSLSSSEAVTPIFTSNLTPNLTPPYNLISFLMNSTPFGVQTR